MVCDDVETMAWYWIVLIALGYLIVTIFLVAVPLQRFIDIDELAPVIFLISLLWPAMLTIVPFLFIGKLLVWLAGSKEKQKEQDFTHHEADESLQEAVTHQMEDEQVIDDYVRKGLDEVCLRYTEVQANCAWFENGYCKKGLPGTKCEINGCVAHMPIIFRD